MATAKLSIRAGKAHPLGATADSKGVNFSLFSRHATGVELLIFDRHDSPDPMQVLKFDPFENRTFFFWHMYVRGMKPGMCYAYHIDGPWDPAAGHRFNRKKVIIDPYAKGNTDALWNRGDACGPGDNLRTSMRSVVTGCSDYDWEGDRPLNRPIHETIIYEMHVGGFTRSKTSRAKNPGKFAGVIEKIPYLKELGITAVELLPVMQFDGKAEMRKGPDSKPLMNYWGYGTIGFFAPHPGYCKSPEEKCGLSEFRDMVKALHKAGIEVILDVVFNHTDEGDEHGPTLSFRGLDNSIYYHLSPDDRSRYMNYTGCGNTVNCNHPICEKFILECLEYWVREMHIDGFRFDEASILTRGEDGSAFRHPPVLWDIDLSETLADSKIIAEAWDAGGLYQIGSFPGFRWAEWNGKFRDDVRRFVKGDPGMVGAVASRIAGSADIYGGSGHLPTNSVNFITCHDGFTLNDLVSYSGKHNLVNGENNRDGVDDNLSWNCGAEGGTDDTAIERLRTRQVKNFTAILLLSQGVPMILGGDEFRRTQNGNNNAYCQDNETSWFDWERVKRHREVFDFFKFMIAFNKRHHSLQRKTFFDGSVNKRGLKDIAWHGCRLNSPGWDDPGARSLAFTIAGFGGESDIHVMMNMHSEPLGFELPPLKGRHWRRAADTSLPHPEDTSVPGWEVAITGANYIVNSHSVVVLVSR
jgi:isoamylase